MNPEEVGVAVIVTPSYHNRASPAEVTFLDAVCGETMIFRHIRG
jgi:hypothetical protein